MDRKLMDGDVATIRDELKADPPPVRRPGCTDEEWVEELAAWMGSETLPRALEPPDSWKRIAAWLRARFGRSAHAH
jgi:hypothetical protein